MPAYNVEKYIEASIKSVLNQTYRNWELIIVDDGSTDLTSQKVKQFEGLDKRIKYIFQNNAKQATARNNGIHNAKGEILAFLDADDLWLPQKLEISVAFFECNKYDLLFTDAYYSDTKEIDIIHTELKKMNVLEKEYYDKEGIIAFIESNKIPMLTVLIKKSVVIKAGFFDIKFEVAEDYDLWLRLLKNKCIFKSISSPLSIYRMQENSSSSMDRLATEGVLKSLIKNFNNVELDEMNVSPLIKNWIRRWIRLYLTKDNVPELKKILKHFKYQKLTIRISFLICYFINFEYFKRLIIKTISN